MEEFAKMDDAVADIMIAPALAALRLIEKDIGFDFVVGVEL